MYLYEEALSEYIFKERSEGISDGRKQALEDYITDTLALFNPFEIDEILSGMKDFDFGQVVEGFEELYEIYRDREEILSGLTEYKKSYYKGYMITVLVIAAVPVKLDKVNKLKNKTIDNPCPLSISSSDNINIAGNCKKDVMGELRELKKKDTKKSKVAIPGDYKTQITGKMNHVVGFEIKSIAGNKSYEGGHSLSEMKKGDYELAIIHKGETKYNGDGSVNTKDYPYRGTVKVKDGNDLVEKKLNNGNSSFFPDSWDRKRIQEEVEHAIENNGGYIPGKKESDGIWGWSKTDPKFKIQIQMSTDGKISSFFPLFD